jgi:hypothetical protein
MDDEAPLRAALEAMRVDPSGGLAMMCGTAAVRYYGVGATRTVVDAISAVLAALAAHPTEFYVVVNGCSALAQMMSGRGAGAESIRAAVSNRGGVDALLSVLRAIREPAWEAHLPMSAEVRPIWRLDALHAVVCKALAGTCRGSSAAAERNARHVMAAGALDGLLAWPRLGDVEEDFTPHEHIYSVLSWLLQDDEKVLREGALAAASAAGVPAALASLLLLAATADAERALHACVWLHLLAAADAACAAAAGAAGAVQGVLTALQAHPADVQLAKHGLAALASLTKRTEDDNARRAVAGGAGAVVVATMRAHEGAAAVQLHGCFALQHCIQHGGNDASFAASAGAAGALSVVAAAMRTHAANSEARVAAFEAVSFLMAAHENAARARAAGVIELLVAAMALHERELQQQPGVDDQQCIACLTLCALCSRSPENALRAGAVGAFEALAALLRFTARPSTQQGVWLLTQAQVAVYTLLTGQGTAVNEGRALRAGILKLIPRDCGPNEDVHARLSRAAAAEAEAAAAALLAEEEAERAAKAALPPRSSRRSRNKKSGSAGGGGGGDAGAADAAAAAEEAEPRAADNTDSAAQQPAVSAAAERRRRRAAAKAASRRASAVSPGAGSVDDATAPGQDPAEPEVAPSQLPSEPAAAADADTGASDIVQDAAAVLPPRAPSPPAPPTAADEPAAPVVGASEPPADPGAGGPAAAADAPSAEAAARLTGVCAVCMDAPLEGVFMLCGHVAACVECGERVMAARAVCPICEQPAVHFARLFLCSAQS